MKILKFNESEEKKYTLAEYKEVCTKMRDVLEIGSDDPIDVLDAVKNLKFKLDRVNKNQLYFYQQD